MGAARTSGRACGWALGALLASGAVMFLAAGTVVAQAAATDLAVRVTATTFAVGMPGRYVVSVSNNGPATTDAEIRLEVSLPPGLAFSSASGSWTCSASAEGVVCTNTQPVVASRSSTFVINVAVDPRAVPRVATQFTLRYGGDTRPSNNVLFKVTSVRPSRRPLPTWTATPTLRPGLPTPTPTRTLSPTISATPTLTRTATATATPVPATTNLALSKSNPAPFFVNQTGLYRLTVTNLGPNPTNVPLTVVDTLPRGLTFTSASGADWACNATGSVVTCSFAGSLAAGSVTTVTLAVRVGSDAYPTVTNVATLSYPGDPDLTNNTARKPTTVKR